MAILLAEIFSAGADWAVLLDQRPDSRVGLEAAADLQLRCLRDEPLDDGLERLRALGSLHILETQGWMVRVNSDAGRSRAITQPLPAFQNRWNGLLTIVSPATLIRTGYSPASLRAYTVV